MELQKRQEQDFGKGDIIMKLVNNRVKRALSLALCLAMLPVLPAYGADNREKISSIKLTVTCETKPEAGKEIGTVSVAISDGRVEVTEPAHFVDTDEDVWIRGEIPTIQVELSVKEPAKYRFTSSTKVTASGARSEVHSKRVLDSGDGLRVELRLPKVAGDLEETVDFYWDGRRARWSDVDGADKYEVRLYRGNTLVTTITTTGTGYNFYPHMNRAGEYTFRVRGLSSSDGEKGPWSERSDEFYLSSGDVYTGATPGDDSSNGPGSTGTPGNPGNSGGPGSGSTNWNAGWNQDQQGWFYRQADGNPVRSNWIYVDNNWFYLGADGYMCTGWIYVDNNWFYLNPVSDGTKGAMKTGAVCVDGRWYYLNPVSDGTRGAVKTGWVWIDNQLYYMDPSEGQPGGAMKTGYHRIDGGLYYLDPGSGILWRGRNIPDGRWADENGRIWE